MMQVYDYSTYTSRRTTLVRLIHELLGDYYGGMILVGAAFENEQYVFRQERNFYYLTGNKEPGLVLTIDVNTQKTIMYTPQFESSRSQWVVGDDITAENSAVWGINEVKPLGQPQRGYSLAPYVSYAAYRTLCEDIQQCIAQGKKIYTLYTPEGGVNWSHSAFIDRLTHHIPELSTHIIDISSLMARMRRKKEVTEIEKMQQAIDITAVAQEHAAQIIVPEAYECEVQGIIEGTFISCGARVAFPSIVAGGVNGTILHYQLNNAELRTGDLVVVDIGAQYDEYCADITRTYPVSGVFSAEQKELYTIVLETQEYIASCARPGYWLSHRDHPEKSLHHLARAFLKKYNYDSYFPHGIGHFLGLEVHDVGDSTQPLQEGDVITIEPGIYIPEKRVGIRIEDNYLITNEGVTCLSEEIPKQIEDIEYSMEKGNK
jgi:Xaa-Pro aminopeptidase